MRKNSGRKVDFEKVVHTSRESHGYSPTATFGMPFKFSILGFLLKPSLASRSAISSSSLGKAQRCARKRQKPQLSTSSLVRILKMSQTSRAERKPRAGLQKSSSITERRSAGEPLFNGSERKRQKQEPTSRHASDKGPSEKSDDETSDDSILDDGGVVMVGLVVGEVSNDRGSEDESKHPDGDDGGHSEGVRVDIVGDHPKTIFSGGVEDGVRLEQLVAQLGVGGLEGCQHICHLFTQRTKIEVDLCAGHDGKSGRQATFEAVVKNPAAWPENQL